MNFSLLGIVFFLLLLFFVFLPSSSLDSSVLASYAEGVLSEARATLLQNEAKHTHRLRALYEEFLSGNAYLTTQLEASLRSELREKLGQNRDNNNDSFEFPLAQLVQLRSVLLSRFDNFTPELLLLAQNNNHTLEELEVSSFPWTSEQVSHDYAFQLTYWEQRTFANISPVEFLNQNWSKSPHLAPTIKFSIEWFNARTNFIAQLIVRCESSDIRVQIVEFFIRALNSLFQLRNFNGMMGKKELLYPRNFFFVDSPFGFVKRIVSLTFDRDSRCFQQCARETVAFHLAARRAFAFARFARAQFGVSTRAQLQHLPTVPSCSR